MKAQMFLLTAIILIASIAISILTLKPASIEIEKKNLIMRFEKENLDNLADELNNAIIFSYNNPDNMTLNAFNFANFSKEKMAERAFDLKLFFVGIVSNVSKGEMNVTTINLMGEEINVSLQLNSSTPQQASTTNLADYGKWSTTFTIAQNTDYSLNITYSLNTKNVTIKVRESDIYTVYFDIRLESDNAMHRKIFEESYNL